MKKMIRHKRFHPAASLCGGLLAALLLLACGCDKTAQETAAPHDATVSETERPVGTETTPAPEPPPDVDVSAYEALVISKVYGNGGSPYAPCARSFVELTNTGSSPLELGVLALYYRTGNAAYASFDLPDATLEGGERYLIGSAARPALADPACEVIRVEDCDALWDMTLDNRDIRLALAPRGIVPERSAPPEELPGVISYFAAASDDRLDTGYVSGYTKNTVAVRTAMGRDSGYYLQDLTKTTTEKLAQIVPVTQAGVSAAVVGSMLGEVRFSHPAGFYDAPIRLELEAPAGYDTIYYTTDGSDPASSGTRKTYAGAISLADTTLTNFGTTYRAGLNYVSRIASPTGMMLGARVVKACAFDGQAYTGVYTNSYFINAAMKTYGVTVMSVSLERGQMFGDPGFYHNFNPSSNDPNTRGRAFMEVFDRDGVRRGYSNVEVAASGHGSSGGGMRSMKVFYKASQNGADGTEPSLRYDLFDGYAVNAAGQRITDFSRLVLRNSGNDCGVSYIRDAYMQRVSRDLAADTMAYAPVLLFINGDFWGVYNARERYSGDYIESHYGIDKDNVALIESDYSQVHTNQNAPFIVSSGLENDADDFNALWKYIRKNDMAEDAHYRYVLDRMDVDSLIDLFVARLYFSALDFPGNNIKVWRDRTAARAGNADENGRWHFVLLDMDMGISFYKGENDTTETSNYFGWLGSNGTVASGIVHNLLANDDFRTRFLLRFRRALNEVYVPERMEEILDTIVAEREPVADLQSLRWGADGHTYRSAIADMRRFVQRRNKFALTFLCSYFKISEAELNALTASGTGTAE